MLTRKKTEDIARDVLEQHLLRVDVKIRTAIRESLEQGAVLTQYEDLAQRHKALKAAYDCAWTHLGLTEQSLVYQAYAKSLEQQGFKQEGRVPNYPRYR